MKKEDDWAVPLLLPLPPIAAATVARPRRPPHMMLVFSRFSPKKVPFEDTTEAVVVEAEAAARRAAAVGGSGAAAGHYHISRFCCSRRPGGAAGRAPTPRVPVLTTPPRATPADRPAVATPETSHADAIDPLMPQLSRPTPSPRLRQRLCL